MLRNGIPEEIVQRAADRVVGVPRVGQQGKGDAAAARRRDAWSCATARCRCCTGRGTALPTRSSGTRSARILIAADHLIKHISSNPLISRPLDDRRGGGPGAAPAGARHLSGVAAPHARDAGRDRAVRATASRSPTTSRLIDERFEFHRRRADKIYGLIAEQPRTGYDLAQAMFGDIAVTQAYLTLSEVLGHVDLLLNEGRVREVEQDGIAHFEAT